MIKDKQLMRFSVLIPLVILGVLTYLVLKPILLSIIFGLLLAYVFLPVYKKVYKIFRERNTAALAVCVLIVLIIFIPLWFLVPVIIKQALELFNNVQDFDVKGVVETLFPISNSQFEAEISGAIAGFVDNISLSSIDFLVGFLLDIPNLLLHLAVIVFVFFFTLRDQDKLRAFMNDISPFKKDKQKVLVKHFKSLTSSIIFGYVIVGIVQGLATGIGLLIFGVPQPLVLTIIAIFASILPMIGPWLVWIPVSGMLLLNGNTGAAIGFAIYSVAFVSLIDNFLRPYIVSRKTGVSSVIVLIGMIGGLLVFGMMGIILGPLILAYIVLFLEAYRNNTLSDMFH